MVSVFFLSPGNELNIVFLQLKIISKLHGVHNKLLASHVSCVI